MAKSKKEKKKVITEKMCRRVRRSDGLKMKTVMGYTFPDFMEAIASRYGKRTCYRVFRTGEENDITYSQLIWNAEAAASYWLSIGIEKGDRIAVIGESSPEWMTLYLSIVSIGAVAVPVLPDFPSRDMLSIISESGAKAVCINTKQFPKIEEVKDDLIIVRMDDMVHVPSFEGEHSFKEAPGYSLRQQKIRKAEIDARKPAEDDTVLMNQTRNKDIADCRTICSIFCFNCIMNRISSIARIITLKYPADFFLKPCDMLP